MSYKCPQCKEDYLLVNDHITSSDDEGIIVIHSLKCPSCYYEIEEDQFVKPKDNFSENFCENMNKEEISQFLADLAGFEEEEGYCKIGNKLREIAKLFAKYKEDHLAMEAMRKRNCDKVEIFDSSKPEFRFRAAIGSEGNQVNIISEFGEDPALVVNNLVMRRLKNG